MAERGITASEFFAALAGTFVLETALWAADRAWNAKSVPSAMGFCGVACVLVFGPIAAMLRLRTKSRPAARSTRSGGCR